MQCTDCAQQPWTKECLWVQGEQSIVPVLGVQNNSGPRVDLDLAIFTTTMFHP